MTRSYNDRIFGEPEDSKAKVKSGFGFALPSATYPAGVLSPRPLRARIRNQINLAVVVALVLFAFPLAVAIDRLLTSQALATLQRDASWAVAGVPDTQVHPGARVPVPPSHDGTSIGLYNVAGRRVAGVGPPQSNLAAATRDGREHHGTEAGTLTVALPILSDGHPVASVLAASPSGSLRDEIWIGWGLLTALAALVFGVAAGLARYSARRIAGPFEHITRTAQDLATAREPTAPPTTGIAEADAASAALHESAHQVKALLAAERAFVRNASHQLRTPLTALALHLQQDPPDVGAALERADHLESTIGDLLAVRTPAPGGRCQPAEVARQVIERRRAVDPIELRADDTADVATSEAVVRQCLDIMLDNAVRHGRGPIIVTVEAYGDKVLLEVADHGPGFAPEAKPGTGLSLAEQLARQAGGQILVRRHRPHPRIALLLPADPNT